jgi:sec-independent protein translocase protein TatA
MFNQIGLPEILVVLVIALLVFGPKRLPELGRSLGRGMRSFKDAISGEDEKEKPPEIEGGKTDYSEHAAETPAEPEVASKPKA